jgi:hypothetical protein
MTFERICRHHIAGLFTPRERTHFKNTPSVPTPAAPQAVSAAQTGSNVDTAVANATLGNVNQVGPMGSTAYNETGGKMVNGNWVPSYTQTTSLNPTLQDILTRTQNTADTLAPTGQYLANEAAQTAPMGLYMGGVNNNIIQGGPQALDQSATNTIYQGENSLLQPTFDQQQKQLQDQLSRQGIPLGSDAYGNAQTQLGTQQNQQRTAALGQATGQGITSANNMFNLALLGQNQQIGQQQTAQSNPINLLKQLYSTGA